MPSRIPARARALFTIVLMVALALATEAGQRWK